MLSQRRKQNNIHMKKLAGLLSIILLLSMTMEGQERKERKERHRKGADLTTEQMATLKTKKMTLFLDLDQNQQKEIYNLLKEQTELRQSKMAAFKEKRKEGVELTSDDKFQMQNDQLDQQIKNKAAMKNLLSKEQFEKFEKASKRKRQAMNKKRGSKGQGDRSGRPERHKK